MKEELIIPPTLLNLIATNKCTAACKDCCFGCNPQKQDKLTLSNMKQYVDQAIQTYNTVQVLVLTGGECFTLGNNLDKIVKYASEKGLRVRVVTNGYWATSFEQAYSRLKRLTEAGLNEFNISTGDEHQKWVSYDNVIYAIAAALELRLLIAVNVEISPISQFNAEQIKQDIRLEKYQSILKEHLHIISGVWVPFKESTKQKHENHIKTDTSKLLRIEKIGRCTTLFNSIHIYPNCYMTKAQEFRDNPTAVLAEYGYHGSIYLDENVLNITKALADENINEAIKKNDIKAFIKLCKEKEIISPLNKNLFHDKFYQEQLNRIYTDPAFSKYKEILESKGILRSTIEDNIDDVDFGVFSPVLFGILVVVVSVAVIAAIGFVVTMSTKVKVCEIALPNEPNIDIKEREISTFDVFTLKTGMENTYIALEGYEEEEFDECVEIVREISPTYFDTHSETEVKNLMKINIINNL